MDLIKPSFFSATDLKSPNKGFNNVVEVKSPGRRYVPKIREPSFEREEKLILEEEETKKA